MTDIYLKVNSVDCLLEGSGSARCGSRRPTGILSITRISWAWPLPLSRFSPRFWENFSRQDEVSGLACCTRPRSLKFGAAEIAGNLFFR